MLNIKETQAMLMEDNGKTLSIYLDVDRAKQENQATQPAWRIDLKNALTAATEQMGADHEAIVSRATAFFDSYEPQSKGLTAFFTADTQTVHELAVPVNSHWSFGTPLLLPLIWSLDEYERYLIVRVDQEKAELLSGYLGTARVESNLESDVDQYDFGEKTLMPSGNGITEGSNRDAFESMINEHIARFHREVVSEIETLQKAHPKTRIILGGSEQAAHAVRDFMPEHLAVLVVGILPLPMHLTQGEVMKHIAPAVQDYERDQEMGLVKQVIDFAKARGRGALGHKAVDEALTMQRVELLLLPYPTTDEEQANQLIARTFASGGAVELVHGESADLLNQEGGIGARLYYAL